MKGKLTLLVFLSMLFSSVSLYSQFYFEYSYDLSGNRIQRKVVIIQSGNSSQSFKTGDAKTEDTLTSQPTPRTTLIAADVFPNPTYGITNVMISEQGIFTGVLYNMEGKEVMQQMFNNGQNQMDLSNVEDGQFILRIIDANGRKQEFKIIKKS